MARIGDNVWQCDLDKKVYDYANGYTDEKGNKVPGGDVANQTKLDNTSSYQMFDTRPERLSGYLK